MEPKPIVQLIGEDGNAFAIIGACKVAMRRAGWPREEILKVTTELMTSEDYNHLLRAVMTKFDVR